VEQRRNTHHTRPVDTVEIDGDRRLRVRRTLRLTDAANEEQSRAALIAEQQSRYDSRQHRLIGDCPCKQVVAADRGNTRGRVLQARGAVCCRDDDPLQRCTLLLSSLRGKKCQAPNSAARKSKWLGCTCPLRPRAPQHGAI